MRAIRLWQHLALLKRAGIVFLPGGIESAALGSAAVHCYACPRQLFSPEDMNEEDKLPEPHEVPGSGELTGTPSDKLRGRSETVVYPPVLPNVQPPSLQASDSQSPGLQSAVVSPSTSAPVTDSLQQEAPPQADGASAEGPLEPPFLLAVEEDLEDLPRYVRAFYFTSPSHNAGFKMGD